MNSKVIILLISIFSFSQIWSQDKEKERKIFFGGGMQLNISNNYTALGISPSAIYEISDKFATGIGGSYTYIKHKYTDTRYNLIGISTLALYNPIEQLQLSTEFEELNIDVKYDDDSTINYWNPAWYMGVAYRMGRHASMGLRYDVLYDEDKSIYDSPLTPFVRIYF